MNPFVVHSLNDSKLRGVVEGLTVAITDTLASFVDRPLQVEPCGSLQTVQPNDWVASIAGTKAVIRGRLDGEGSDGGDHHLLLALDLIDAITLSGHLMLTSEDVIDADRDTLDFRQEHLEAFGEVGNILCAAITTALRRDIGPQAGMRIRDFKTISAGSDAQPLLGSGPALVYDFDLKIDDYPPSRISVLIDPDTGRLWNDAEVFVQQAPTDQSEMAQTAEDAQVERCQVAAYVTNVETASIMREAGEKLGLDIRHHARTDIPNPAAHPGEIVLIEVPVGEEKRFEWAKRLKQYPRDIDVVLLIHEASRHRVVQGLMSRSNVILAWPSREEQLRAKLEPLLAERNGSDRG